jgi:hypothetical protein
METLFSKLFNYTTNKNNDDDNDNNNDNNFYIAKYYFADESKKKKLKGKHENNKYIIRRFDEIDEIDKVEG